MWIYLETKYCCLLIGDAQKFCCAFIGNIFIGKIEQKQTINIVSKTEHNMNF